MSKQSILKMLQEFEDKNLPMNEHVLVCVEVDDNGIPVGSAIKIKGTPFQSIGMIEMVMRKLEEARESIFEKFESVENASRAINNLPKEMVDKIRKFEDEARDAVMNGDMEKLRSLKDKIKNELGISGDDDDTDESGFNINDFKG
jgi:hypothetical protein